MPDPWREPASPLWRASIAAHVAAPAICVLVPGSWPLVVAGLAADHGFLVAGSLWPRSRLLGPNLLRLPASRSADREVALTFDDGPDPEVTPRVLDLLDAHRARATFFCIAQRAEAHPGLVGEIVRRGHRVENHSYRHSKAFCFLGPRSLGRELDRAQESLTRLTGSAPRWFRAPAGLRNPWLERQLSARRLSLVTWTRRAFDTVVANPDSVAERLCRNLAAGDILVLHDRGGAATPAGQPVVVEALPIVLRNCATAGLRPVPLPTPGQVDDHRW